MLQYLFTSRQVTCFFPPYDKFFFSDGERESTLAVSMRILGCNISEYSLINGCFCLADSYRCCHYSRKTTLLINDIRRSLYVTSAYHLGGVERPY